MNKIKKILAIAFAAMMLASVSVATPAFAADVNSVASVESDADLTTGSTASSITGQDVSQSQFTTYEKVTIDEEAQDISTSVYATQAAGEKVYDPENPEADEDGFVDGSVQSLLPKTVILSGTSESLEIGEETYQANVGKYVVSVKGNIAGDTYIKVSPTAEFKMQQVGKDDITAKMYQEKQHFYLADCTLEEANSDVLGVKTVTTSFEDSVFVGTVYTTTPITAGNWSSEIGEGAPSFTVQLVTVE